MKLQGQRYKWEPQPIVEGEAMPGTGYSRGSVLPNGGVVLGVSDNEKFVGVHYADRDCVIEYPVTRFAELFRRQS